MDSLNKGLYNGTDTALTNLRAYLSTQSDTAILRHFLGFALPNAPELLNSAIVMGLDTVRWENKPNPLTEIGVAELSLFIQPGHDIGTHCENALSNIRAAHMRLKPYAHLLNKQAGAGNPETFAFGTTVFVDENEAKEALTQCFRRPVDWDHPDGPILPMIFIGHGIATDIGNLKETIGVDVFAYGSIVKIIDIQTLAFNIPYLSYSRTAGHNLTTISLQMLLADFGIPIQFFNTAGNDIAYTLILAILLSYNDQSASLPRPTQNNVHISTIIENVKTTAKADGPLDFGDVQWCTRCSGKGHCRQNCKAELSCDYCRASSSVKAQQTAYTHMVEKCLFKANLVRSGTRSDDGSDDGFGSGYAGRGRGGYFNRGRGDRGGLRGRSVFGGRGGFSGRGRGLYSPGEYDDRGGYGGRGARGRGGEAMLDYGNGY